MFAAAATKGDVTVCNVIPKHLEATIAKLLEIGCEVEEFDDAVRVCFQGRTHQYACEDTAISGIPDRYAAADRCYACSLQREQVSITESIFENRFKYLDELARMGACVKVEGNSAIDRRCGEAFGSTCQCTGSTCRSCALHRRTCSRWYYNCR